jgi:hypothetical protein
MLLLVAAVLALGSETTAPAPWRRVEAGVEHLRLPEGETELLRFDLDLYQVNVVVPGAGQPRTAADIRAEQKAALAINGGFFDTDGRPLGLRIGDGKVILGLRRRVDWGVLLVRDGRAAIVHSRDYVPDARISAAVQVGPRILIEGQVPPLKPQSARRTAVAVDPSGRFLTIVVTRARASATGLGQLLARLGFHHALMFDGGPSTQLSASVGAFSLEVPGLYPVPDLLFVAPRARRP